MQETIQNFVRKLNLDWEKISVISFVIFSMIFAYSLYILINKPADPSVKAQIQEEIKAVEIKFDTKTVDNIKELKSYKKTINTDVSGRNPFITF